jgi:hypothetical protein
MIIKGSRYTQSSETRNNETKNVAVPNKYLTNNFITIIAEDGQTLQYLASIYLNDASMYWKIADLNLNIMYPDKLTAGTVVKIPML